MKIKTTELILALCFFGAALCFADDPQMSTSKPNESKTKVTPGTEKIKPMYISLVQFTDKGIQDAKQTTQRVAAWAAKVQSMEVTIKQMYWTSVRTTKCAFSRPRTMRPPPVCCCQRTCWGHPDADDAGFDSLRDGEDPGQGALTAPRPTTRVNDADFRDQARDAMGQRPAVPL